MRFRESILIDATPAQVWAVVEDPELLSTWYDSFTAYEPISEGERCEGFRFRAAFTLSERLMAMEGVIADYVPQERLCYTLDNPVAEGKVSPDMVCHMRYTLTPDTGGVRVEQEIEVLNSGIPRILEWVFEKLAQYGQSKNAISLNKLRDMVIASLR